MNRFWSSLILLVLIGGVLTFWLAPGFQIWFPEDVSLHGYVQDDLFMFILYLTGAVFVGTQIVLFWFLWKYSRRDANRQVAYTHGSHSLEVVWTIIPAATLLFIAIFQLNAWAEFKIDRPTTLGPNGTTIPMPPLVEVKARQFEWRLRYAGEDNKLYTEDDQFTVNELVIPVNETIIVDLKSEDVLHSFFIPAMRVKQDAVPGMKIPVWFTATKTGEYDLVCAELCGWGHYKMKGRIKVVSAEDFETWKKTTLAAQNDTTGQSKSEGEE